MREQGVGKLFSVRGLVVNISDVVTSLSQLLNSASLALKWPEANV